MANLHQRRIVILLLVGAVFCMFVGSLIALFVTARIQQDLVNREPEYSARQLYDKARDQVGEGNYTTAEEYLETALSQEDDATFRNQLAVVKYRLKKYDQAIDHYQKLIEQGKDAAFAWNGIGNAYRDWAESNEAKRSVYEQSAEDAYLKAITLNANYIAAYSNLAILYQSQGKKEEALAILDQGIEATKSQELIATRNTISTP